MDIGENFDLPTPAQGAPALGISNRACAKYVSVSSKSKTAIKHRTFRHLKFEQTPAFLLIPILLACAKMSDADQRHRVVVMGAGKGGKSCILKRFLFDTYTDDYKETVEDLYCRDYNVRGQCIKVNVCSVVMSVLRVYVWNVAMSVILLSLMLSVMLLYLLRLLCQ